MDLTALKYYKQEKGYSFAALSEISGVPLGTVQKIFDGETKAPRKKTIEALEKALYPKDGPAMPSDKVSITDFYSHPSSSTELLNGSIYPVRQLSDDENNLMDALAVQLERDISSMPDPAKKCRSWQIFRPASRIKLRDEYTLMEAPLVLTTHKNQVLKDQIFGAPDLVILTASFLKAPSSLFLKMHLMAVCGVRECLLVDIENEEVQAFRFLPGEENLFQAFGFNEEIPLSVFNDTLCLDLSAFSSYLNEGDARPSTDNYERKSSITDKVVSSEESTPKNSPWFLD